MSNSHRQESSPLGSRSRGKVMSNGNSSRPASSVMKAYRLAQAECRHKCAPVHTPRRVFEFDRDCLRACSVSPCQTILTNGVFSWTPIIKGFPNFGWVKCGGSEQNLLSIPIGWPVGLYRPRAGGFIPRCSCKKAYSSPLGFLLGFELAIHSVFLLSFAYHKLVKPFVSSRDKQARCYTFFLCCLVTSVARFCGWAGREKQGRLC